MHSILCISVFSLFFSSLNLKCYGQHGGGTLVILLKKKIRLCYTGARTNDCVFVWPSRKLRSCRSRMRRWGIAWWKWTKMWVFHAVILAGFWIKFTEMCKISRGRGEVYIRFSVELLRCVSGNYQFPCLCQLRPPQSAKQGEKGDITAHLNADSFQW